MSALVALKCKLEIRDAFLAELLGVVFKQLLGFLE
jgi:hypothetical protein